jgi:hypothetical protein
MAARAHRLTVMAELKARFGSISVAYRLGPIAQPPWWRRLILG